MGNREALLTGAKQSLIDHGWARSTVRTIAAAAGVNHAAIGYHFGSREDLLTQALIDAVSELSDEIDKRTRGESDAARWRALIDSFATHRGLWLAQVEAIVQAQRSEATRSQLAAVQQQIRDKLGGPLPLALLDGLMLQTLVDADSLGDTNLLSRRIAGSCDSYSAPHADRPCSR